MFIWAVLAMVVQEAFRFKALGFGPMVWVKHRVFVVQHDPRSDLEPVLAEGHSRSRRPHRGDGYTGVTKAFVDRRLYGHYRVR